MLVVNKIKQHLFTSEKKDSLQFSKRFHSIQHDWKNLEEIQFMSLNGLFEEFKKCDLEIAVWDKFIILKFLIVQKYNSFDFSIMVQESQDQLSKVYSDK